MRVDNGYTKLIVPVLPYSIWYWKTSVPGPDTPGIPRKKFSRKTVLLL